MTAPESQELVERVARIIDPEAWDETHADDNDQVAAIFAEAWEEALAKARAILALSASPPPPVEPPVEGWRTIESAPRDGTWIDVWAEGVRWANVFWRPAYSAWARQEPRRSHRVTVVFTDLSPSHWRSLPSPPGEAASPARGPSHRLDDDKAKPSTSLGGDSRASVASSSLPDGRSAPHSHSGREG